MTPVAELNKLYFPLARSQMSSSLIFACFKLIRCILTERAELSAPFLPLSEYICKASTLNEPLGVAVYSPDNSAITAVCLPQDTVVLQT